jgi:SOS-response transcriptional repressor LexA
MLTFAERIKKARCEARLSQHALAEAMSQIVDKKIISRSAVAQWESSKTNGIEAANLLKAAKILNVTPHWLQFGYGEMRPNHSNFPLNACVPLLRCIQVTHAMNKEKEFSSIVGLDEQLAKIASPHSFALVIQDFSMAPLFMPEDIVIFDPEVKPCPGEFVVATLKEDLVVFRKYRPLSCSNADEFELIAINEDWNSISIQNKKQGMIIGTLIEHRCRRRIHHASTVE